MGGGLRIPNYIYATQPLHTYFLLLPPIHSTLVTASSLISLPIQRNIRRSVPLHPHPSRSSEMHIHALPLNSRNHIMEMVGMPEKTPRVNQVVSLFCGAGGFCQGCVEAGCKVVLAVDSDETALKTHRANHPDTLHLCSAARPPPQITDKIARRSQNSRVGENPSVTDSRCGITDVHVS